MRPRYKWLSDWVYYFVVLPVSALLPARLAVALAKRRGRHFAGIHSSRRQRIASAIHDALPTAPADRVALHTFESEAAEELDMFYYPAWTEATVAGSFRFSGLEYVDRALAGGRGAVLVTAHIGSFCGAVVALGARGYGLNYLAHNSPDDPAFSAAFRRYARLKIQRMQDSSSRQIVLFDLASPEDTRREAGLAAFSVLDRLRDNELISVAFDVAPQLASNSAAIDFLGTRCRFPTGFLKVARLHESPVLPYFTLREPEDWSRHRIVILEPVELTGDPATDLQRCARPLEEAIREHPEQWLGWDAMGEFKC